MNLGMFDFFEMADNYEQRKVAHYEKKGGLVVDTAAVTDSSKPFETGISHPSYNNGKWVIVELYDNKKQARNGHKRWIKLMTSKQLPKSLKDVSTATTANLIDAARNDSWREYPKL